MHLPTARDRHTLLYDVAVALVACGLVFVAAAWLSGHMRPATALQRVLAPILRTRPAAGYIAAYAVLPLAIIWGPTPATRQIACMTVGALTDAEFATEKSVLINAS